MANPNEPPLDEIQWRSPPIVAQMGGLHSNMILFYFAESPFFERTSNNAIIMSQAMNNASMYHFIQTREVFEGRLKTMSGLEFIVGEEPAETGPGMGTGVWVIRKQTRRKRYQDEDEITVHASFFVVGENIYMAPNLADILASRIMTISSAIAKALPAAESARKWRPSTGHVYYLPTNQASSRQKGQGQASQENTPMPDGPAKPTPALQKNGELSLERASEEAFMTHMRHGGEYIDENPITGRPGEFHLSSTGRKAVPPPKAGTESGIGAMNGPTLITKFDDKKDGKADKTPKSATMPKLKRRKSKMSNGPTPAQTPTAS
ncbi:Mediator of RNA polymerase II transcription subunit 6 [Tolypocladium ophioglossoides CBS 100239]|uniref:Mediator of RNA polymerase II transcription subunit 6 n=1 Tax=Tolypocladium ophioglossoides (strain CBS 100239) TaxID=1163406 RepID=A0A0L0NHM8_TOLOC|nr:Mediator of RNA polymerase II transcription subunit 6 [Tolypocladium ophioglossoides CBS 100239]